MNVQFEYIAGLAKTYNRYSEAAETLYDALNSLPEDELREIFTEYSETTGRFGPVNALRIEVAHRLLNGLQITKDLVEEIKDGIREKNVDEFTHLPEDFQKHIARYRTGGKDPFSMWVNDWSLFYTFIYRGKVKQTTQIYLEQLSKQLLEDLDLPDYEFHTVDFVGMRKTGSDYCWIGLYPKDKGSHKDGHQFFLSISHEPEAGRGIGSGLGEWKPDIERVNSYEESLSVLRAKREEILTLNKQIRNYFKYDPGNHPLAKQLLDVESMISADYAEYNLGDISNTKSLDEINVAMNRPADGNSYEGSWNLWLLKSANPGDIVFLSRGRNKCLGICAIDGAYEFDSAAVGYRHRRRVKWITRKTYDYEPSATSSMRALFRPDFFAPTLAAQFIFSEYVRLYPELEKVFDDYAIEYSPPPVEIEEEIVGTIPADSELAYWWLNANPRMWKVSDLEVGETQTYTTRNEKGNKRRIYKYFEAAKEGDLVIGYESSPVKQVNSLLEISKGIHSSEQGEVVEFRMLEKLEIPVFWNELNNNASLENCEVFKNNQGSLFRLSKDEYEVIREIVDEKNIAIESRLGSQEVHPYEFDKDPDKPFISAENFDQSVELLKRKKNIILQGPPGVGKTFIARKIAYQMMGEVNDAQIEMVQFHQSYSYEDFIQGIRPERNNFVLKNGSFYLFCQQAHAHPKRNFFFIIDEINRGNLSKIFGELMMLIEADKREKKFELKLTYSEDAEDRFFIPPNVFLIGTMNTADRSLAIVDYALRRRFAFINLAPTYNEAFCLFLNENGASRDLVDHICSAVETVNKTILDDIDLGAGFQIGHSYFCSKKPEDDEQIWFDEVIEFEVKPLLEEIWFDDQGKVDSALSKLKFRNGNPD